MLERLETIYKRYEEIKEELTKNEVISDLEKLKKLSKEQRDLEEVVTEYLKYKEVVKQISEDKELLEDEELKEVAKEELASLEVQEAELLKKLEILLLPKDENDGKNVILEIRGALVAMKRTFLQVTYLECIKNMLKDKTGILKLLAKKKEAAEVFLRLSLLSREIMFIRN